jgi:hypothetical protein
MELFLHAFLISALYLVKRLIHVDYDGHAAQMEKNEESARNFGKGGKSLGRREKSGRIILSDFWKNTL